jgi:hypothetical protein
MASWYGEWFYYDGRKLRLGRPARPPDKPSTTAATWKACKWICRCCPSIPSTRAT